MVAGVTLEVIGMRLVSPSRQISHDEITAIHCHRIICRATPATVGEQTEVSRAQIMVIGERLVSTVAATQSKSKK